MKNSEIHNGLENAEIRNFLAKALITAYRAEVNNKKVLIPFDRNALIEWSIKDCEADIVFHQKRLELLKQKQAVLQLIKMYKWFEFDVSDYVEHDMLPEYMNFIGTAEEYKKLFNND